MGGDTAVNTDILMTKQYCSLTAFVKFGVCSFVECVGVW